MPMTDYEQALVFAAKNGNEKSFEELYKIYYQKVYSLAKATLKNDADAEDVLQQTFILAWKNISSLEDNSAFNTWIQRITLNQCYSLMRKNKPEISIDEENDEHGVLELESDLMLPEVYAQQEDLRIRLGRIIDGLSEVQRQTVQLFYFDNMSVEEIASVMDCSVGTVKSRLFLARKAIRTEIEETERKTGTKFYGIAGIPMLAFGKLFASQAEAASIQASSAIASYSKITSEIFGTAKNIIIESAQKITSGVEQVATQTAESAATKGITETAEKQTIKSVKNVTKKVTSSVVKGVGSRIVAAVVSAGILCGSVVGSFADVSAAKVAVPENSDDAKCTPAYYAYVDILNEKKDLLNAYTWQKGHTGTGDYWINDEPKPVVIADVCGDDTPELIYVAGGTDQSCYCADLHIATYRNGSVVELYNSAWDSVAGGGFYYYLFKGKTDKSLYAYKSYGDDYWVNEYARFAEENGQLVQKDVLKYDRHPDYDNIVNGTLMSIDKYTLDDKEISENEYNNQKSKLCESTNSVLMYSANIPDEITSFIIENGCAAMTCSEAILYLKGQIGNSYTVDVKDIPESLGRFLKQFHFGYSNQEFNSSHPVNDTESSSIIYRIMTNGSCCMTSLYPGKASISHWDDGTTDPKNQYTVNGHCSYLESSIEKAKWIAKNIFNISDNDIAESIKYAEDKGLFYIQDGTAYLLLGGVGGPDTVIDYDSIVYDGSRYHITYTHYIDGSFADTASTHTAELDYKMVDGCCYWSLYNRKDYAPENTETGNGNSQVNADSLFDYLDGIEFTFASGVGAWSTTTTIYSDGSFKGAFSDWDAMSEIENYSANSISNFSGRFVNPQKINDYVFTVELKELSTEKTPGVTWIDENTKTKYTAAEPYGMEIGSKYFFYLPGAETSLLPEMYMNWICSPNFWSETPSKYFSYFSAIPSRLPFWGMYNEEGQYGFYSTESEVKQNTAASNEISTCSISFVNDKTIDLKWGWNLFNKDASEYDHNIAMAGLILSQAAESGESVIKTRYKELGFENTSTIYYSGRTDNMDMPASCFASSKIKLNGETKYVVSITVRGTSDPGDILTDVGSVIYGFNTAANNVKDAFKNYYSSLSDYYHDSVTPNNTILFITGHSLGGAIAGQLGQMLEGISGHRNCIFDYTFASPNYQTFEYDIDSFTNIHNIVNTQDIVPTVPWGYKKYGHCWYYDSCENGLESYLRSVYTDEEWEEIQKGLHDNTLIFIGALNRGITGIKANHICQTYMACMLKDVPSNIGEGAKSTYSLSSIHCPVDIQILDKDGNVAAWTSGGKAYYAQGANLIIVVDKDEKYVYVPDGIEYNIVFIGTDTGTMNYTQQVISNDEVVSEKTFENVSIETGKLLYASVNAETASTQKLKVIDESGHIQKDVKESGKETTPILSLSIFGWLFLCLDVVSVVSLIISILSIIKKKKDNNCQRMRI